MSGLTRRRFGALAAASSLVPAFARAMPRVPLVIAEGGAAAERPEDTRSAYDQAISEGADFIQVNLVPTKDNILVARRDNEISATTDVSAHPEFAARRATKTIGGAQVTGWFTEDFTLAELKTLLCRERQPALRPQNNRYAGKEPILTLPEVLSIARDGCVRTMRTIGVMPRMLHVSYFEGLDFAFPDLLANELNNAGYNSAAAAIWVQAFEPQALKDLSQLTRVRRMQLIDVPGGAPDPSTPYAQMTTTAGLTDVHAYAQAIGPHQDLVIDPNAAAFPAPTTLVLDAHAAGLTVCTRTACGENALLPRLLQRGDPKSSNFPAGRGDVGKLLVALFSNGADGVATSVPNQAARARQAAMKAMQRGGAGQP